MTDKTELRMNLTAIKRIDPYAKDILDSSAHVAFYTFNSEENEWEKTDVEGALFIYSRNAEPFHSIFINNRINTNSFVEPITGNLELQSQPPFLLYRNERSRIRGFWFYNSSECDRIGEIVRCLIAECGTKKDNGSNGGGIIGNGGNGGNILQKSIEAPIPPNNSVNIFTMLSKAQEEFNNTTNTVHHQINNVPQPPPPGIPTVIGIGIGGGPVNNIGNNICMPTVQNLESRTMFSNIQQNNNHINNKVHPDLTSQSVMNFFANAKPAVVSEAPSFQRLISSPVPVEQIEKQQRASTPHENVGVGIGSGGRISSPVHLTSIKNNSGATDLNHSPKMRITNDIITPLSSLNLHDKEKLTKLPPELDLQQKLIQKITNSLVSQQAQQTNIVQPPPGMMNHQNNALSSIGSNGSGTGSGHKPELMPPTMFLSSSSSASNEQQTAIQTQQQPMPNQINSILTSGVYAVKDLSNIQSSALTTSAIGRPEPLTQTQLQQAFYYLLQNDPEFIRKMHEAYLKFFNEKVTV